MCRAQAGAGDRAGGARGWVLLGRCAGAGQGPRAAAAGGEWARAWRVTAPVTRGGVPTHAPGAACMPHARRLPPRLRRRPPRVWPAVGADSMHACMRAAAP